MRDFIEKIINSDNNYKSWTHFYKTVRFIISTSYIKITTYTTVGHLMKRTIFIFYIMISFTCKTIYICSSLNISMSFFVNKH